MNKNTGWPAFPIVGTQEQLLEIGMTLRDYFAAKAMQGIYACPVQLHEADGTPASDPLTDRDIARLAYAQADAMLAERNKE